jgi:hypothetical protein
LPEKRSSRYFRTPPNGISALRCSKVCSMLKRGADSQSAGCPLGRGLRTPDVVEFVVSPWPTSVRLKSICPGSRNCGAISGVRRFISALPDAAPPSGSRRVSDLLMSWNWVEPGGGARLQPSPPPKWLTLFPRANRNCGRHQEFGVSTRQTESLRHALYWPGQN